MIRRVDLKTIAYWVGLLALATNTLWLCIEVYDAITHTHDHRKAAVKLLWIALSVGAATMAILHPPKG